MLKVGRDKSLFTEVVARETRQKGRLDETEYLSQLDTVGRT